MMPIWKTKSAEFKKLWRYSIGFYAVWVAHVGRRTGLFETIARHPISAKELAAQSSFNFAAVDVWCSAAVALGFVKVRGDKIFLTATMREILLDKKSANFLGGLLSYSALRSLDYGWLENRIKAGSTREMTSTFDAIVEATDWDHHAFLSAIMQGKIRSIHTLLSRGCRVLDVGCGTGTFIKKLLENYPRSSFVGIEPSEAVFHAKEMVPKGKPVKILRQTGEAMNFENEFDIVYLGESLYAASDKLAILLNCNRALKKGGTITIVEGLLPDNNYVKERNDHDEESQLIMGMQIDFSLQGYRFMSKKEIRKLLKDAGFSRPLFRDFGGSLYLVTAWKHSF